MRAALRRISGAAARLGGAGGHRKFAGVEPPLRSELFSADQMERHGRSLAGAHRVAPGRAPDRLLARLGGNEGVLVEVWDLLSAAVAAHQRITPAAEWLLDNFHLIEEQIRTARRHLPKGYSRELPRLAHGPSAGLPRVYDLAFEAISHGDGRVDAESLTRFVAAYQEVTPLALGELWAIPIMLRLALIENLRRVGSRVAAGTLDRASADAWADQMMDAAEHDPKSLILVIADMARSEPPMVSPFVAELARRLRGQSAALALPLTWIEQRLSESGLSIEQLVQSEAQEQAGVQVSIGNTIGSLRVLGAIDWREFVESMSIVERALREDPGGVYARMDFATRDRYRHVVEEIARVSAFAESEVALAATRMARESAGGSGGDDDRASHVGFYLVGPGRARLEEAASMRVSFAKAARRAARGMRLPLYLGAIAAMTVGLTAGLAALAWSGDIGEEALPALAIVLLLATSQAAVGMVNWLATLLVKPLALPRMDFSRGIAPGSRTLVVVPTMLVDERSTESLLEALEVRFLANRDEHLHFGLLTDFPDAPAQSAPGDEPLLSLARAGIEALNAKYGRAAGPGGEARPGDSFFLFHRPRLWNAQERLWMGYERKRGKLADLNALLRGRGDGRFSLVVGEVAALAGVKYVITLDTDTQLPRDSARQFVGAMAHPLNRARFDAGDKRVVEGYGILQPRVSISLPGSSRTWQARLYGGEPGIDPYTRAVSDVYQDVFEEGSFIGKGIYDVDAFERAVGGRFPENRILSHDLLEGCYARSGLLSDVQLYEEYPSTYAADIRRRHRWIRGDWQLAGWLRALRARPRRAPAGEPAVRCSRSGSSSTTCGAASSRRPSCWCCCSDGPCRARPGCGRSPSSRSPRSPRRARSSSISLRKPREVLLRQHLAATAADAGRHAARLVLALSFLPYEAMVGLDAIARTAWRVLVVHRRRLEWSPSVPDEPGRRPGGEGSIAALASSARRMGSAPAFAAAATVLLALWAPYALPAAAPLLLLWLVSPAIAWWISRPLARRAARLTPGQGRFLRSLARRTWAFFENFVGAQEHWLPPDNWQEHPVAALAHRTSPTNMGLALLANLTAFDFGYIPAGELLRRTAGALGSMEGLERHEGHFYNWYDTQTLKPLPPLYVSSVDSGNLAGHLMTLRPGLAALADEPVVHARWFAGLGDTLQALVDARGGDGAAPIHRLREDLEAASRLPPATIADARRWLDRIAASVAAVAGPAAPADPVPDGDGAYWSDALVRQCRALQDEIAIFAPGAERESRREIPTLRELAVLEAGAGPATDRMAAIESLARRCDELARMDYGFLYDGERHLLAIGYNVAERTRDTSYYDLLASEARLASFVAIAQGQLPQENWFALGRLLTTAGGGPVLLSWSGSMFEYLMPLLVMPALRGHAARPDLPGDGAAADRLRPAARRALGHLGVRLQLGRREPELPVPRLRRAGPGPEARARGGPRRRALRLGARADGGARGVVREPAAPGRRGAGRALRPLRGHRLHAGARAARPGERHRPLLHGAPPGHDPALALAPAARAPDAEALRGGPALQGDPAAAAGAHPQGRGAAPASGRVLRRPRHAGRAGGAGARARESRHAGAGGAAAVERPLPRHGHERRAAEARAGRTSPSPAGARTARATTGARSATSATRRAGSSGRARTSPRAGARTATRRSSPSRARSSAAGTETSRPTPRSSSRRKTTSSCAGSTSPTARGRGARSTSRATRRSRSRRRRRTRSTRPSPTSSCRRRSSRAARPSCARAGRAPGTSRRPGCSTSWPSMARARSAHPARRTAPRSSGAGARPPRPARWPRRGRWPAGEGSVLDPVVAIRQRDRARAAARRSSSTWPPAWPTRARPPWASSASTRTGGSPTASSTWRGRTAGWRCGRSTPRSPTRRPMRASRAASCTRTRRCAPWRASSLRNRRGQSGLWSYAISGDLPIVLLQIGDAENIELVRQLVQAHAYWRLKGLAVDLVIWNEDRGGYRQVLQDQIMGLIAAGIEAHAIDRPGGIFVRRAEQIADEDRILLQSVARAIVTDRRGSLAEQVGAARRRRRRGCRRFEPTRTRRVEAPRRRSDRRAPLILGNGLGGFTPDGTRVRHHRARGPVDARAVVQRAREPGLRHRGLRERARPTPGARTRTSSGSRPGTTTR